MQKKNKLPKEVIDVWPEVFEEIEMVAIPMQYILGMQVFFENGTIYDIEMDSNDPFYDSDIIEDSMNTFLDENQDSILDIQLQINTEKVIEDAIATVGKITS